MQYMNFTIRKIINGTKKCQAKAETFVTRTCLFILSEIDMIHCDLTPCSLRYTKALHNEVVAPTLSVSR